VSPQPVEHDNLSDLEGRRQELLDIGLEEKGVGGTFDGDGLSHPSPQGDRGDEGLVLSAVSRYLGVSPFSPRSSRPKPRHGGLKAGLVDEHEASGVEAGSQPLPKPPHLFVTL